MSSKLLRHLFLLLIVVACLGAGWTPDRRPIGLFWTGPNPHEWTPALIKEHVTDRIKARPWTRYMIHMPASWEHGAGGMSGSQYWTVERSRRLAYREAVAKGNELRKHVYIYGGIMAGSAFSLKGPLHGNDFYDASDHYNMWDQTIAPWVRWGVDGWIFDAGAVVEYQPSALAWCDWLRVEQATWAAIEAFPLKGCPDCKIDEAVALKVPCVAQWGYNPSFGQWVAPAGSEMHVWLQGPPGHRMMTVDEVVDLIKRNFIPDPDKWHDEIVIEAYQKAGIQIP